MLIDTKHNHLRKVAHCHILSFPESISSLLGINYVAKMFEWYLVSSNRFLFHIEIKGEIIGYCGGYMRLNEPYGSSSGMTQHAFREGIMSLLSHPWIILNPKVIKNIFFLTRNIYYKFFPEVSPIMENTTIDNNSRIKNLTGLVVIGVNPKFHGKGFGSVLLKEFERRAIQLNSGGMSLVVESGNSAAIRAYVRNGWSIKKTSKDSMQMFKEIVVH